MRSRLFLVVGPLLALATLAACESRATLKKADHYMERGRYQQAIEVLRTIYLENPLDKNSAEALWRIGNIYRLNLKDFHKAKDAYTVLTERFPESSLYSKAQMQLAKIYSEQLNDYERAVVAYQQVVSAKDIGQDERVQAKFEAGTAYYNMGNFEQARIEYEAVVQLAPDSLMAKKAQLNLAQAYDTDGDFDHALARFRQLAQLPPIINPQSDAEKSHATAIAEIIQQAKFGEAAALEELGHHAEALAAFQAILESYPSRRVVEIHIERLTQRMRQVNR